MLCIFGGLWVFFLVVFLVVLNGILLRFVGFKIRGVRFLRKSDFVMIIF